MTKAQQLAQAAQQKRDAAKGLLAKLKGGDAEVTHESVVAAFKEVETAQAEAEAEATKEAELADIESKFGAQDAAHAAGRFPGGAAPGGGDVSVGYKHAGEFYVDREKGEGSFSAGIPGMSEKIFSAISTKSYGDTWEKYIRKGRQSLSEPELKIMAEGSDPDGGFWVPPDRQNRLIQRQPAPTRVAGLVDMVNTSRDVVEMPAVRYSADDKYTTGVRVSWVGEKTDSTKHRTANPQAGEVKIDVHTAMLSLLVSRNFIEDSAVDVMGFLTGKYNETIDQEKDRTILVGSGQGQPAGIILNPGAADEPRVVTSGHATQLTADGLTALPFSIPEQYHENCRYAMNFQNTGLAVSTLKDSDGRYIIGQGLQDSGLQTPAIRQTLRGYPIAYSAWMPDIAASAFPVIFGDFKGYLSVNRVGFSIEVLREKYAEDNAVCLVGRLRIGGKLVEPWRLSAHKVSV